MTLKDHVGTALTVLVVIVAVALIAGQFLGQPILLSFVETGSMEPTIRTGDGFVAIPTAVSGDVQEGDVITFDAEEIEGGGLTTHRVVGEGERGYITRGDANPFTDQDNNEPPVQDAQIVAKAWQPGGSVVTIPHLGTAALAIQGGLESLQQQLAVTFGTRLFLGTQGLANLFFGLSIVAYVADAYLSGGKQKNRERDRTREKGTSVLLIAGVFAMVVMGAATMAMVVPSETHEFGVVSAEFDSDRPDVIRSGESDTQEFLVPNAGVLGVQVYFEPGSDEIAVSERHVAVGGQAEQSVEVTRTAPDETGFYRLFLEERRYLAVLPEPVITGLYQVHPLVPLVVINAMLGGSMFLLSYALIGSGRVRNRKRERPSNWSVRSLLSKLYR